MSQHDWHHITITARRKLSDMFWTKWLTWAKWALKRNISTIYFDSLFFNLCGTDIDLLYKHFFLLCHWSWSRVANVWIGAVSSAWLHAKHIGASGLDVNTRDLNKFDLTHLFFNSYRWYCPLIGVAFTRQVASKTRLLGITMSEARGFRRQICQLSRFPMTVKSPILELCVWLYICARKCVYICLCVRSYAYACWCVH